MLCQNENDDSENLSRGMNLLIFSKVDVSSTQLSPFWQSKKAQSYEKRQRRALPSDLDRLTPYGKLANIIKQTLLTNFCKRLLRGITVC